MGIVRHLVILSVISYGAAVSLRKQLEHVAIRKLENQNYNNIARRFFVDNMAPSGSLLGVPALPSHLPEAEPILPGHTLLRPALGMLKSAVKFPHRELENGAGVYGHVDNMGIKYDGLNERILYTGFRRIPSDYILVLPQRSENDKKTKFILGAPLYVRPNHFYNDPQDDNEINENRLETQRAIEEFFQKAKEGVQDTQKNRETKLTHKVFRRMYCGYMKQIALPVKKAVPVKITRIRILKHPMKTRKLGLQSLSSGYANPKRSKCYYQPSSGSDAYAFTHIKVNSFAPEHTEFLPLSEDDFEQIRNWWYYNQDDFQVFDEKELARQMKKIDVNENKRQ